MGNAPALHAQALFRRIFAEKQSLLLSKFMDRNGQKNQLIFPALNPSS